MIPIFIGGTGRSGTTILKKVLASNSHVVAMPFELRMVVDPGGALDLVHFLSNRWSPYNADIAIHQFKRIAQECAFTSLPWRVVARSLAAIGISPWRYSQVGIATVVGNKYYRERVGFLLDEVVHDITAGNWTGSFPFQVRSKIYEAGPFEKAVIAVIVARFVHDLYCAIPNASVSTHWVEDTPYNLIHAVELCDLFPDMRLIHIYRDPRDVLASYRTKIWGGDDVVVIARRLAGILERWFIIREHLPKECFMELALEQLAEGPKEHLARICEFAGIQCEPAMMDIPLNQVNAGRWLGELSRTESELILPILAPYVKQLGYEL